MRDGVDVGVIVGVLVAMVMLFRIVRALSPIIGSLLATERSIKGTNRTSGKKSPLIVTLMRVVLFGNGVMPLSDVPSHGLPARAAVPGPLS